MLEFINQNIYSILLVIVIIGWILYLIKIGQENTAKKIVTKLVQEAEEYFESGEGKQKKEYVIREFYKKSPVLNYLLPQKELDNIIELVVKELKENLME